MPVFMVSGQVIAIVTPFDAKGRLMTDAFVEILRWHLDCGASGFLVAGDNGEAWALKPDELKTITTLAVRETRAARAPVFVGSSAITGERTAELSRLAAEAGADGLCLQPQSYVLNATPAEIVQRFAHVHREVPLPIVLYNHPARTGVNMTPDILASVCDAVPVVGLKEAGGDFAQLTRTIARFHDRFAILTGPAEYIIPALQLGAAGYISTGPELLGRAARRILESESMTVAERRDLHCRITAAFRAVQFVGTRPAGIKAALGLLGLPAGVPREPLLPLGPAEIAKLRADLEACGALERPAARRVG